MGKGGCGKEGLEALAEWDRSVTEQKDMGGAEDTRGCGRAGPEDTANRGCGRAGIGGCGRLGIVGGGSEELDDTGIEGCGKAGLEDTGGRLWHSNTGGCGRAEDTGGEQA